MNSVIEVRNLTKLYGQVIGVNDITLELPPGVYGLVGPNGSGKSTFFKLILGFLKPTIGTVLVFGEKIWNNRDILRRVGFCPEYDSFYPFMTGLEFVSILCQMYGLRADDAKEKSKKALDIVGLADVINKKITTYSRGMRQRLKVAQAIAHEPDLLVLDEPLSFTDPLGRIQITNAIKEYAKGGRTILLATHILHEIEALTENFILILKGRILAYGNIHEIRDLLNQFPHHIYIQCSNPRLLAEMLSKESYVQGFEFNHNDSSITIYTYDPKSFYTNLPFIVEETKITVKQLKSEDDTFEAVFKYLLKESE